jgi:hypothetical protein
MQKNHDQIAKWALCKGETLIRNRILIKQPAKINWKVVIECFEVSLPVLQTPFK